MNTYLTIFYMCGSRGDRGSGPPWKITKIVGSLSILVRIPLKSQSYQSSIQCWAIIGPPVKRHLNGVALTGRWWPANSSIWNLPPPHQTKNRKKEKKKRKRFQSWTPLTKLSGSTHVLRTAWDLFFAGHTGCHYNLCREEVHFFRLVSHGITYFFAI